MALGEHELHALIEGYELPESFLETLHRPAWRADALCREPAYAGVTFFPARGQDSAAAKEVCGRCQVQEECLAYALEHDEDHGIWGGLSRQQRRKVRRAAA